MKSHIKTGTAVVAEWFTDLQSGTPPKRYTVGSPFASLDVQPGRLILIGGPPGHGKTAALLQIGIDLLRANPDVRLLMANVEMAPTMLLERIISRLSKVPASNLRDRQLNLDEQGRLLIARKTLAPLLDRLAFMQPPFTMKQLATAADESKANLLIIDYIQRFKWNNLGADQRQDLDGCMSVLRGFCNAGAVVLCASAVARQKNQTGSSYSNLNMASFRGSSELEFGADSLYLLNNVESGNRIQFVCEKNRYGPLEDISTLFDPSVQSFTEAPKLTGAEAFDAAKPVPKTRRKAKRGEQCNN